MAGGVVCCVLGGYTIIPGVVLILLGGAMLALSIFAWRKWKNTPAEIVCIDGTEMQLPQGRYALSALHDVSYFRPLAALKARWGRLCVEFEDKVFVYDFVAEAAETQQKLVSARLGACNAPIDR